MSSIPEILSSNVVRSFEEFTKDRILLVDSQSPIEVLRCATMAQAQNVVNEKNPFCQVELESAAAMVLSPASIVEFPLCTILSPKSCSREQELALCRYSVRFSSSAEKVGILGRMGEELKGVGLSDSVWHDIRLVADELMTNAVYNAPFANTNEKMDRKNCVTLEEGLFATIKLAWIDERVVLVCEDPFGSLQIRPFLDGILRCYEENPANCINWSKGGAGIGSFFIFANCLSLFIGVQANQKTVFGCVFFPTREGRLLTEKNKGIHYASF